MDVVMRIRIFGTCLLISAFQVTLGTAATILVPDHRSTIQAGIDAARSGDVVSVRPGTYKEQLNLQGKAIVLRGAGARKTVIDGSDLGSHVRGAVVQFVQGEGVGTVLDGFTITGRKHRGLYESGGIQCSGSSPTIISCVVTENEGNGIHCFDAASPVITHCRISDNFGSGVYCYGDSDPVLTSCTISGNDAYFGGGIYCNNSDPVITSCTISDNSAHTLYGGGVSCNNSSPTLSNCTISGNRSAWPGGGIYCSLSDPILTNCLISGNDSESAGGGLYFSYSSPELTNCLVTENSTERVGGGVCAESNSSPRFTYCTIADNTASEAGGIYSTQTTALYGSIVWGNHPADSYQQNLSTAFCNIEGGVPGQGNIEADPQFASYRDYDYLLEAGSPCIDAGSAEIPDGIRWPSWYPNRGRSDMGAWGGPDAAGWLR